MNRARAAIRRLSATTVRKTLGAILDDVQRRRGRIVIAKRGKPVAALVEIALLERLRKLDEEFEQISSAAAKAFAGVDAARGGAIVDEAVEAARRSRARPNS